MEINAMNERRRETKRNACYSIDKNDGSGSLRLLNSAFLEVKVEYPTEHKLVST